MTRAEWRAFTIGAVFALALALGALEWHDSAVRGELAAARDSTQAALQARSEAVETVTVHVPVVRAARAESDRLAGLVGLAGPTTLTVRTTPAAPAVLVEVPPEVVQKMRADSATIAAQGEHIRRQQLVIAADSVVIGAQATEIQLQGRRIGQLERQKLILKVAAVALATIAIAK